MGGSSSKPKNGGANSQPPPVSAEAAGSKDSLQIDVPERKDEWDEKAKWDERSGLRAFCIVHHDQYGFLLLQAEKRKKGLHHQAILHQKMGVSLTRATGCHGTDLGIKPASQAACARELFEETGIDLRNDPGRFELCAVAAGQASLKGRVFYWVNITQAESVQATGRTAKAGTGEDFSIRLSGEHVGFVFEKSYKRAADMLIWHSGGKCSDALLRICALRNHQASGTG